MLRFPCTQSHKTPRKKLPRGNRSRCRFLMLRFPCTQCHKTPRKISPGGNRSSCCPHPLSLSSPFACMTHLVLVIIASFILGSFFALMAEANDSELGQEKQKNKNPVVENDSYPVVDCDGVAVENDYCSIGPSCDDEVGEHSMKKKRKKKKREIFISREKKAEEDSAKNKQDPLVLFGSDILMKILRNLDARSVALSLLVSRGWYGVASSDRLWTTKCEELWLGKAHIPRSAQVRGLSKLATYSISVMDGRRTRIMKEDLCDHVWEFHFHEAAPEYWRNLDPYWKGTGPPMRRSFHPDGSLTADPGDEAWGGHESCYSIVTSVIGDGSIRDHYVRINRWPRMLVMRKEDWSWEMSNNLYCYSSIPDADKEGGTGPLFPFS